MLRLAVFLIVAISLALTRGLAVTQSLPGPQATSPAPETTLPPPLETPAPEQTLPPELDITWDWLTNVLPTSTVDATGQRILAQHYAQYEVNGCDLIVSTGTWSHATSSDTAVWPDPLDRVYLVRFEARLGRYFYDRRMSDDEVRLFQQRHSGAAGQFKYGYVSVIDMSDASLSTFTVIDQERAAYLPFAGVGGRGKYAFFRFDDESHAYAVRKALLNAATACGATSEPS
jgi:hypothetical protein